jgi:putative ABC transport system permease protein
MFRNYFRMAFRSLSKNKLYTVINVLGLAVPRTREIGVRKVLGASVAGIVTLLSMDFVWLVGLSILIASPIAWYGMHRWLTDFAYHVPVHVAVFGLAGLTAMGIALATVSIQAIRAARANPVKSLRTE